MGDCESGKWWKRLGNRRLRRANKVRLQKQGENFIPKIIHEVMNPWMECDHYYGWFGDLKYGKDDILFYHWEVKKKTFNKSRKKNIVEWRKWYFSPLTEEEREVLKEMQIEDYKKFMRK